MKIDNLKECCVEVLASYPNYNDCPEELYYSDDYDDSLHDKPMLGKEFSENNYWKILWIDNPVIDKEMIIKDVDWNYFHDTEEITWYKCIVKHIRE